MAQEIVMSKHNPARKRKAQAMPPSRKRDTDQPRASGGPEQGATAVTIEPASPVRPEEGPGPSHDQIAVRAYELWEAQGGPEGTDRENWFEAEQQLRVEIESSPGASQPAAITMEKIGKYKLSDAIPEPPPDAVGDKGGRPVPTHETAAEQIREAKESEEARSAEASNRDRMVDIGRGNQQAGRQGQ
jgi:hypothetical protein